MPGANVFPKQASIKVLLMPAQAIDHALRESDKRSRLLIQDHYLFAQSPDAVVGIDAQQDIQPI